MARTLVWVHSWLSNWLQTGTDQDIHLQSALVQASVFLKHQPTGQFKRTRPLTSYPVSQSHVLPTKSRSWSCVFTDQEGWKCILQNSHLLWFQSLLCRPSLVVSSGVLWTVKLPIKHHTKNAITDVISSQPIVCPSDQQADHVTHRTTTASKYSSQALSQQLSNIQVRHAIKGNTLINGGNLQQAEFNTKDSCKIALAIGYRVYRPVPATQPCTLASTTGCRVYRPVPATQPCTLASTTGYRAG